jgi:hypothetical protein
MNSNMDVDGMPSHFFYVRHSKPAISQLNANSILLRWKPTTHQSLPAWPLKTPLKEPINEQR